MNATRHAATSATLLFFDTNPTSTAESSDNVKTFVFPDENIIAVGPERFRCAEVLFQVEFSAFEASKMEAALTTT